jgi:hypothetical protein
MSDAASDHRERIVTLADKALETTIASSSPTGPRSPR